jgi:peptidoglycan/LPS O-acetylase OafA/YrhL
LTSGRRRFALFDSLRALAALSIVVFHAATMTYTNLNAWYGGLTSHLDIGVSFFFVISSFLLYRPYAQSLVEGSARPPTLRYARRRVLRIVPAYWVALTVLAWWPGLGGVFTSQWWVYYGFLQTYRAKWTLSGMGTAWSLSVEVAFYALLPVFCIALTPLCRGRTPRARVKVQLFVLGFFVVAGVLLHAWLLRRNPLLHALPSFLAQFAAGMSLAVVSVWLADRAPGSRWIRLVLDHPGLFWISAFAIYLGIASSDQFPRPFDGRNYSAFALTVQHVLYTIIALLVILPAVFGEAEGGWPRRILASRVLTGIGTISYGIFLWHFSLLSVCFRSFAADLVPGWPLLSVLLPGVPLTLVCGWLSYRAIERPALRAGSRSR